MLAKVEVLGRIERYTAWALYLYARPSIETIAKSRSLVFSMLLLSKLVRLLLPLPVSLGLMSSTCPSQHWLTTADCWSLKYSELQGLSANGCPSPARADEG